MSEASTSRPVVRSAVSRRSARRSVLASTLVGSALLLPVGLATVLLIQNGRAQSRQREIVRNALREYAAVAAWQFTRRVSESLHSVAAEAMHGVADLIDAQVPPRADLSPREPAALLVHDSTFTRCSVLGKALFAFRVDLPARSLVVTDSSVTTAVRVALIDRAIDAARHGSEPHRIIADTVVGVRRTIVLAVVRGRTTSPKTIYGVVADSTALDAAFQSAAATPGLLPPALLGDTVASRHMRIALASPTGRPLFAFGTALIATEFAIDSATVNGQGQPFVTTVGIAPSLAASLVGGGLARASWPPLLALLIATVLITVAAAYQLHRGLQLSRLRADFVANVSHELRTPLAQISMFAETLTLDRVRSPAERRHFSGVIQREARRLTNLVERVMRFAAFDSDRAELAIESRDLACDVRETIDSFQPIANAVDVTISLRAWANPMPGGCVGNPSGAAESSRQRGEAPGRRTRRVGYRVARRRGRRDCRRRRRSWNSSGRRRANLRGLHASAYRGRAARFRRRNRLGCRA